jgi:hypothetical protein
LIGGRFKRPAAAALHRGHVADGRRARRGNQTLPSTKTLVRYAEATGSKFRVRLSAA